MKKNLYIILALIFLAVLVRYFYFKPMLVLGQPCPQFSAMTTTGKSIDLSTYRGKYLLLDFWGSWCAPCRHENPALVMMYERYKGKAYKNATDIEFVSIALERDSFQAVEAIRKDGLIWPDQIIQDQSLSAPLAKLFNIRQIPTKYLIGPDGLIVLSDPSIEDLDDYLAFQTIKN